MDAKKEMNVDEFEAGFKGIIDRYKWFIGVIIALVLLIVGLFGYQFVGLTETVADSKQKAESIRTEADSVLDRAQAALNEAEDRKKDREREDKEKAGEEKLADRMTTLMDRQMDFYTEQTNRVSYESAGLRKELGNLDGRFKAVDDKLVEVERVGSKADGLMRDSEKKLQDMLAAAKTDLDTLIKQNSGLTGEVAVLRGEVEALKNKATTMEKWPLHANTNRNFASNKYVMIRDGNGNLSINTYHRRTEKQQVLLPPWKPKLGDAVTVPGTKLELVVTDLSEPWMVVVRTAS